MTTTPNTTAEVIALFIAGERGQSRSLVSTGWALYSYGVPIARRTGAESITANRLLERHKTKTTVKHQNMLTAALDRRTEVER